MTPLHQEFTTALANAQSKAPRTFRRWVEDELVIPDGPFAGEKFNIDRQPAARLWLDAVDDDHWTDCVFQAVTQFGKTLLGFVAPLLYHTCELGENFVMGVPFGDMAANKWEADILPVLSASPTLRQFIPTRGAGSAGGKIKDSVTLGNGAMLKLMSAGGDDATKAGFTARCFAVTEAAKFSAGSETSVEADPLTQLRGRQRSFPRGERRAYIEGTVTIEFELPWRLRRDSSKSRIVSPCPHCKKYIGPRRADLVGWQEADSELAAAELAHWRCPECEKRITEAQRRESMYAAVLLHDGQTINRRGRVNGPRPLSTRLFFHATPWANLLLSAADIGVEEWLARRIPADSPERNDANKQLSQFVHSEPYVPPKMEGELDLDKKTIANRTIELSRGMLPFDTQLLTVAIDIGETKSWYLALAARENGALHVPDYGMFSVPSKSGPVGEAIYYALRQLLPMLRAGWTIQNGAALRPHQVWIDSGHESEAIWRFTKSALDRPSIDQWIIAARGRGATQMDKVKFRVPKKVLNEVRQIDRTNGLWYVEWVRRGGCFEVHWDSDRMKWRAQHALTLELNAPGSISLFAGPQNLHSTLARHIVNERLMIEFEPGKTGERRVWKRFGDNHYLDCLAEAYCALIRKGYQPPELPDPEDLLDSDGNPLSAPGGDASTVITTTRPAALPAPATARPKTPDEVKQTNWFKKLR